MQFLTLKRDAAREQQQSLVSMAGGSVAEAIASAKRKRTESDDGNEQPYKPKTLILSEDLILAKARIFYPEEILKGKRNLACPVLLQNPDRFAFVHNSCTMGNLNNIGHTK